MPGCSVKNCRNKSKRLQNEEDGRRVQFHKFPKDEVSKRLWSEACGIQYDPNIKYRYVCSLHFTPSDFKPIPDYLRKCAGYDPGKFRKINEHAVPTRNLDCNENTTILQEHITNNNSITVKNSAQSTNGTLVVESCMNFHSYAKSPIGSHRYSSSHTITKLGTKNNGQTYNTALIKNTCTETALAKPFFASCGTNDNIDIKPIIPILPIDVNCNIASVLKTSTGTRVLKIPNAKLAPDPKVNGNILIKLVNDKPESIQPSTKTGAYFNCNGKAVNNKIDENNIERLRAKLMMTEAENKRLLKENIHLKKSTKTDFTRKVEEAFKSVFTPTQIDKILHPSKTKVMWTLKDISSALALRSVSLKAYRYLRKNNYPLPALSTLRKCRSLQQTRQQ